MKGDSWRQLATRATGPSLPVASCRFLSPLHVATIFDQCPIEESSVSDANVPVIVSACRTPVGRFLGGLSSLAAPALGAIAVREAISRAGIGADTIDEVIMGHVLQGGS